MTITPVDVRDNEGIVRAYRDLGFIVLDNAINPQIPPGIRRDIPEYIRQRTNDFVCPYENTTTKFWARSDDLKEVNHGQEVKKWAIYWKYNPEPENDEDKLEAVLRMLTRDLIYGSLQTLKALCEYHEIPFPEEYIPITDMFFYRNHSEKRKQWGFPWHTDTVSIIAMFGGEKGILEVRSPITKKRYQIPVNPNQQVIVFGEEWIAYLRGNGLEPTITETAHRVVIPAVYETRTSFSTGIKFKYHKI